MKNVELVCDVGDSIGYIRKLNTTKDLKQYKLVESAVTKISHNKSGRRVYTGRFRPFDMDEIAVNTKIMNRDSTVVVGELFVLNEKARQKAEHWIENANKHPEMNIDLL